MVSTLLEGNFEARINQTVKELKKINPQLIVPMHCTGWRTAYAIFNAMPDAFIWNSVGNLYMLKPSIWGRKMGEEEVIQEIGRYCVSLEKG